MLLADFGYKVHSQTYIATTESIETKRDQVLGLLRRGLARGLRGPLAAIDLGGAVLLELPATRDDPFVQKQAHLIRRNVGERPH